ncbi:IclR family transcriptional regulator [Patulibacter defluvii]|uniref:IclR family transcriptional regulator n=1 Tax=Patulibacter defluvii TaxID=3095358 RepID=UPI002A754206|nr:IclR family transcriptional regulator [Patulibacter sp. DM4]
MANVPAARRALGVLSLLARQSAPIPAAAIARELELPRSSVYHLLTVLQEEGFVVHLPEDNRYGLGVAAFELGFAYSRQQPLRRIAHATLARLVDDSTHNGHFAVLDGTDVLYLIEERAAGRPSLVTDVGVRLPAHLTASGLAMLAALAPEQLRALYPSRRPLPRRLERGPATRAELRAALAGVRAQGYAWEDGSVTAGFASIACAVLDHTDRPAAAVTLTFRSEQVGPATRDRLVRHVHRAADRIARQIRGRAAPLPASGAPSP